MASKWFSLLAVLALATCLLPSEALRILAVPPNPRVGQSVILSLQEVEYLSICIWIHGNRFDKSKMIFQVENGRVVRRGGGFTGREQLGNRCAITINRLQASDSGEFYVIVLDGRPGRTQIWKDALILLQVNN